ncbi:hypothetical protein ACFL6K_03045 [Candidatus Latescibacterota bacterium]
MRFINWVLILLLAALFFSACEESPLDSEGDVVIDVGKSDELVVSADSLLVEMMNSADEDISMDELLDQVTEIKDLYQQAAAKNPANSTANFGAAVFTFQDLMSHPDVDLMMDTLESWKDDIDNVDYTKYYLTQYFMFGENVITERQEWEDWDGTTYEHTFERYLSPDEAFFRLIFLVQNSLANPNLVALVQDIIDETIIDTLDDAIAYMDVVLTDNTFTYSPDESLLEDDESIEFDLGEAYMISALMRFARANFKIMNSYQGTIPGVNNTTDLFDMTTVLPAIKSQDENSGSFLKLRSNTILPSAKADFLAAISMVESGVNFIKSETDDQMDDLIKKQDVTETDADIDSEFDHSAENFIPLPIFRGATGIMDIADAVESMITTPFDIEINFDSGVETISLNLAAFLNNGIPDIKAVLPYHEWTDFNDLDSGFDGPGIYGDFEDVEGEDIFTAFPTVIEMYIESLGSIEGYFWDYSTYYGTISTEGIFTVQGIYDWTEGKTPLDPGAEITTDGAFYLDSQSRLCMTQAKYTALNAYFTGLDNDTWMKLEVFDSLSDFPKYNFSLDHPFGVRESSGVFKFAGTPNYSFGDNAPLYPTDSAGNRLNMDEENPVFPDPTFGGLFPGMTQLRFEELFDM